MRTFFVDPHQHKGQPYKRALLDAGYQLTREHPDVFITDRDWFSMGKVKGTINKYAGKGAVIMVYPHSAMPPWWYDGVHKVQPQVKCLFVVAEGHREIVKVFAPEIRTEVTGWPWCAQLPYQKPEQPVKVLFGPIHPGGKALPKEKISANRAIFRELVQLAQDGKYEVTIRFIHKMSDQGLRPSDAVKWVRGRPDGSTAEIDAADVVIGEGMFMYLAVARGKPTIGINQHLRMQTYANKGNNFPRHWDQYGDDLAYPINYQQGKLDELIQLAASGEQTAWRERFIGESMDPKRFVEIVDQLWKESKG